MLKILQRIAKFVQMNYSYLFSIPPRIIGRKLRLCFKDGSTMGIYYPSKNEYSLHWWKGGIIVRIDTAPHHKHIRTFPRHIHYLREDNVIEDHITSELNSPEENMRHL